MYMVWFMLWARFEHFGNTKSSLGTLPYFIIAVLSTFGYHSVNESGICHSGRQYRDIFISYLMLPRFLYFEPEWCVRTYVNDQLCTRYIVRAAHKHPGGVIQPTIGTYVRTVKQDAPGCPPRIRPLPAGGRRLEFLLDPDFALFHLGRGVAQPHGESAAIAEVSSHSRTPSGLSMHISRSFLSRAVGNRDREVSNSRMAVRTRRLEGSRLLKKRCTGCGGGRTTSVWRHASWLGWSTPRKANFFVRLQEGQ